jgi:hypothetical protein
MSQFSMNGTIKMDLQFTELAGLVSVSMQLFAASMWRRCETQEGKIEQYNP